MPRPRRTVPWLDWRNGVAYACWYDAESRRTRKLSLGTRDAAEAQARFAAFLTQGSDQYGASSKGMTISQCLKFYFDEHVDPPRPKELHEKWLQLCAIANELDLPEPPAPPKAGIADPVRADIVRRHLERLAGDVAVSNIDVTFCREYAKKRLTEKPSLSLTTLSLELSQLKAAVRHNIKWKRLKPADDPVIEYPAATRKRECWLFKDELRKLRQAADEDMRDFIDLLYYTGSRRRAIETLEWRQVDLDSGVIRLAKPGERKTKKRRPTVPIVPQLQSVLLRRYLEKENGYVLGSDRNRFVQLTTLAKKAGVYDLPERDGRPAERLTAHALRHSRATHLLQDGVGIYAVAKLLGDTVATVERTYGHASMQEMSDALKGSGI